MNGSNENSTLWTWLALLVSAVAVAGSLWLSLGMGLIACPFCFYQRAFAMSVFGVLFLGLLGGARRGRLLCLLALPLAVGGLGVAGWHVSLELRGKMECPGGILGVGTSPQQSLAAFALLTIPLFLGAVAGLGESPAGEPGRTGLAVVAAFILGGLFAAGCVTSTKPVKLPAELLEGAPTICRPPK
ncbi:MAG: disulfide bond formation protein B [Planctomycetes bacterium]|nr:disulfide bond formation protein B [Planctomycetota bacterium]